jgi:hypothetical protein
MEKLIQSSPRESGAENSKRTAAGAGRAPAIERGGVELEVRRVEHGGRRVRQAARALLDPAGGAQASGRCDAFGVFCGTLPGNIGAVRSSFPAVRAVCVGGAAPGLAEHDRLHLRSDAQKSQFPTGRSAL